ncbi:hypothetical protein E4T52_07528 [Aureobasidium sp. EXF-3400]|nr:hypothetical protein E4T51_09547 [Aureobasidium sp. EXF-12344]KAI4777549.1 hypothetical protein E4T52_07528 [Aureobasidium sp. EXF-3400]
MMLFRKPPTWILYTGRVGGLRLLSLPNEVLTMVCTDENLSANDLAAVRLTCKEFHAAATKEFAQRYFKDPFVMMSEKSLESLVEICKHPVFGPHVSKIQMLNTRIHTYWLQNLANEMVIAANNRQVVEIKRIKGQLQWLMDMLEEQNDFKQSERPLELLNEAFSRLKGSGRSLMIGAQRISMPYAPIGLRKAFSGCDEQPHEIFLEPDMISMLQLLLDAVSSAGCMMQRIEIGVGDASWPSSRQWRQVESIRQERRPSTMHAEELHLDLQWHRTDGHANNLSPDLLPLIIENTTRNLKRFSLRSDCDPDGFEGILLENVSLSDWYEGLEEISLTKLCLQEQQLRDFLSVQGISLKRLNLSDLIIIGDWDRLISWVSRTFELERFSLNRGYVLRNRRWNTTIHRAKEWYTTGYLFHSRDEISQGIELFISAQTAARQAEEERKRKETEQQERNRSSRRSSRLLRADGRTRY